MTTPRPAAGRACDPARSYSSRISPTISSTRSSNVTIPAMPPNSSMTTAICTPPPRTTSSSASRPRLFGASTGGIMTSGTGTSPRRPGSTATTCLTCTIPTTSSWSAPSTGKREWPVARVSSTTRRTGSSADTVSTRTRGVRTSSARRRPNSRERASRAAVPAGSVPFSADRCTSDVSSSGERAEASSSCGWTPIHRSARFADRLRSTITGFVARVNPRWNPCTDRAVGSGLARARFLGTSSPNTIVTAVARISAAVTATPGAAVSGTPAAASGSSSSRATAGSARKPIARLVMVMPSCAPDSCVDSVRSADRTPRERRSPPAAACSTTARPTVTKENSAATKAPHVATRRRLTRTRSHSVTGHPIVGRRAGGPPGPREGRPQRRFSPGEPTGADPPPDGRARGDGALRRPRERSGRRPAPAARTRPPPRPGRAGVPGVLLAPAAAVAA